ncbi:MAG: HEAT repeat domain-containing protein [Spirochaetota bacterium]
MRRGLTQILLLLGFAIGAAELPPLFRLPTGGLPMAAPVLDASLTPPAIWFLSDDKSLYLLSEQAALLLKFSLEQPRKFLAVDTAGRALVLVDVLPGGQTRGKPPYLMAITRAGIIAWAQGLGDFVPAGRTIEGAAFGFDGRILLVSGPKLRCVSAAGKSLWDAALPGGADCKPSTDGVGNFLVASGKESDEGGGKAVLTLYSPYGVVLATYGAEQTGEVRATALSPFALVGPSGAAGLADGRVLLLDAETASARSLEAVGAAKAIVDLDFDGKLLAALDAGGSLAVWDAEGKPLWRAETGASEGRLTLLSQRVIVTGRGTALTFTRNGDLLRQATITNAAAAALVSPSGLIFSAGVDWVLAAYTFEPAPGPYSVPRRIPYPSDRSAVSKLLNRDGAINQEERQIALVTDIEKRFDSGRIGASEAQDRAVLEAILSGDFAARGGQADPRHSMFIQPRADACRVLGKIGSPQSVRALLAMVETEADPAMRAAALNAIGDIGLDPEGLCGYPFARMALLERLDDEVAWALIGAIEAMSLASGSPPSALMTRALVGLSGQPYGLTVRERAKATIAKVAGSKGRQGD